MRLTGWACPRCLFDDAREDDSRDRIYDGRQLTAVPVECQSCGFPFTARL